MPAQPDRYAVIGQPVDHSLSPAIHACFADQTGQFIDYRRLPAPADDFTAVANDFFDAGGRGVNVTLPFKTEAISFADSCSERVRAAGAANTLTRGANGRITADNTDGIGLIRDLQNRLGVPVSGARVLILGAGGAVRGAVPALLAEQPARITIANRTRSKAEAIAAETGPLVNAATPDELDAPFDIVINAISAGLSGNMPAIPEVVIDPATIAYDMIYSETPTPFLRWARRLGTQISADGFGMLVEQAAESFRIWRGVMPDTAPVIATLGAH